MMYKGCYDSYEDYLNLVRQMWDSWETTEQELLKALEEAQMEGYGPCGHPSYEEDYEEEEEDLWQEY